MLRFRNALRKPDKLLSRTESLQIQQDAVCAGFRSGVVPDDCRGCFPHALRSHSSSTRRPRASRRPSSRPSEHACDWLAPEVGSASQAVTVFQQTARLSLPRGVCYINPISSDRRSDASHRGPEQSTVVFHIPETVSLNFSEALSNISPTSVAFWRVHRELQKTCVSRLVLPSSYTLLKNALYILVHPFTSSDSSDVYKGTYKNLQVCVKKLKVDSDGRSEKATKERAAVTTIDFSSLSDALTDAL